MKRTYSHSALWLFIVILGVAIAFAGRFYLSDDTNEKARNTEIVEEPREAPHARTAETSAKLPEATPPEIDSQVKVLDEEPRSTLVNGHTTEYWDAIHAAIGKQPTEALAIYNVFVDSYPESVDLPHILSLMAHEYSNLEEYDQAIVAINEAIERCESRAFGDILRVNKADIYSRAGQTAEAIALLITVIDQPAGEDPRESTAQAFIAPERLAHIYADSGDFENAYALLDQAIFDAFTYYEKDPSDIVASYIESAYAQTVRITLQQYPHDYGRARKIIEELGDLLPDSVRPTSHHNQLHHLNNLERRHLSIEQQGGTQQEF